MSLNDPNWGRGGSRGPQGPGGGNQGPPDLDELWRSFNSELAELFGGGGRRRRPGGAAVRGRVAGERLLHRGRGSARRGAHLRTLLAGNQPRPALAPAVAGAGARDRQSF